MKRFVIGVAGGTGSGKTTVAQKIAESVASDVVTLIEHDSYYRDRSDLSFEERSQLNFDHPDSLETSLLVEHLRKLKSGETVDMPVYDFTTHSRKAESVRVHSTPVIVVEGILAFVDSALRDLCDLRVFVDTDADIRVFRRIRRDIEQRGRNFADIREQYYNTVRPMHLQFVEPSKRYAHVILPEGGSNAIALDLIVGKVRQIIGVSIPPPPGL